MKPVSTALLLLAAMTSMTACGQERPELESILESVYPEIAPDTVDLLPGRVRFAFGDLPEIQERGLIRVLVSPSRTNYFIESAAERGFEYEMMQDYWESLNKRTRGRFIMAFLPVSFDELLPALVDGRGDIAAAGLTVTAVRADSVAFTDPYLTNVREVIVGHRDGAEIGSLNDLAGLEVTVVRGSSYEHHLEAVNEQLAAAGLEEIKIVPAPQYVEAEDLLELVDKGFIDFTVTDEHIAQLWSSALSEVRIFAEAPVHEGGGIAWAVRKEDTKLRDDLNRFVKNYKEGSLMGNILFSRYYDDTKWISGPSPEQQERIAEMRSHVQKYAEKHDFDWLLLAALAYQESKLDHSVQSRAGAVGLFQIKPEVAAAKPISVDDVYELENNIKAAIRYLAHVRDHYLSEPELSDVARVDLMLASYNAGPTRIKRLRLQAADKGYDPNRWFGNVERLAPRETITYVANINRFYYAFRLAIRQRDFREELKSAAQSSIGQ